MLPAGAMLPGAAGAQMKRAALSPSVLRLPPSHPLSPPLIPLPLPTAYRRGALTAARPRFSAPACWVPRDQNVRADFLSHASESHRHDCFPIYMGKPAAPPCSPGWTGAGTHTIDRFACAATCQPLSAPFSGRFCSEYFHPAAVWTDAFSAPWADDNSRLLPPVPLIGRALNRARASGARGALVVPLSPGCPWGPLLRPRGRWIPEISEALLLGTRTTNA